MSNKPSGCPALDKINGPAGDCQTVTGYQEYVARQLREELTMPQCREIMAYFHCGIEELVGKIVAAKMEGIPRRGRKA